MYFFKTANQLQKLTKKHNLPISGVCLRYEIEFSGKTKNRVISRMAERIKISKDSIKRGLAAKKSLSGMTGGIAKTLQKALPRIKKMYLSKVMYKAMMYAIANNENNACMGRIVAFPTAGAAGVIPGVLIAVQEEYGYRNKEIIKAMFNAAAIGLIIAENATLSAAQGGCQAEIGASSAMAASALTELRKGSPEVCLEAASLALKNTLGLACDPIAGLVEVPCVKRNGIYAAMAMTASDMAVAGVKSIVPFDEVVLAMKNISGIMPSQIRETAQGGLATTETGLKIKNKLASLMKKYEK